MDELVRSAARWIDEAMRAWANDDFSKVAAVAPLAVEHLGKAVLWDANPVLLVPLNQDAEASLIVLATKPSLVAPKLRTVGMAVLLARLEKMLGTLPVDAARRKRLIDSRNGAVHVGTGTASRHVLLDALLLCQALLGHLDASEKSFFGEHHAAVLGLLDEKRTETGHRVGAKRARARQHLTQLEQQLGTEAFQAACDTLAARVAEIEPRDYGLGFYGKMHDCPECGTEALLMGDVTVDFDVDWDVEPLGGGEYAPIPISVTTVTLAPEAFTCPVCRLELRGLDELAEAGLPSQPLDVREGELAPDFQIADYVDWSDA